MIIAMLRHFDKLSDHRISDHKLGNSRFSDRSVEVTHNNIQ